MKNIVYPPRESVWKIVQYVTEHGQVEMTQALQLIQEYLYCVDGSLTVIQVPNTPEEASLVNLAFSKAYAAFTDFHY